LPVWRRVDFGRLLLWGLGFLFLRWRGGTGFGPLLGERKTLRHVSPIHKAEKGVSAARQRRDLHCVRLANNSTACGFSVLRVEFRKAQHRGHGGRTLRAQRMRGEYWPSFPGLMRGLAFLIFAIRLPCRRSPILFPRRIRTRCFSARME